VSGIFSGAVAIACYISSNPSPLEWVVSGPKASVESMREIVLAVPGAEMVDKAPGSHFDFARFRLPSTARYGDFMTTTIAARQPDLLGSPIAPMIPDCTADGRADDIGNPHVPPVLVGLLGDAEGLARLRRQIPWATLSDMTLADGRRGLAFRPAADQASLYASFLESVAAGDFADSDVVLLSLPPK
jgi:hypothetical protein